MLRQAMEAHLPLGRAAEQYMAAGQLVPDSIILEMVVRRIEAPDCRAGVLFDGFPRTLAQADALDKTLAERGAPLDVVFELRVDDNEILRRLLGRQRSDDRPEILAQRLRSYREQTPPVLEHYQRQGLLEVIDGAGAPDDVFERIKAALIRRHPQLAVDGRKP
jgi:adenylate kinase